MLVLSRTWWLCASGGEHGHAELATGAHRPPAPAERHGDGLSYLRERAVRRSTAPPTPRYPARLSPPARAGGGARARAGGCARAGYGAARPQAAPAPQEGRRVGASQRQGTGTSALSLRDRVSSAWEAMVALRATPCADPSALEHDRSLLLEGQQWTAGTAVWPLSSGTAAQIRLSRLPQGKREPRQAARRVSLGSTLLWRATEALRLPLAPTEQLLSGADRKPRG